MQTNIKFKSRISPAIFIALIFYHLVVAALFILPYFLYRDITTAVGVLMLVLDAVLLLPLIFNTYYTLEKDVLFIHQWPFTRKKIKYSEIFEITDVRPESKKDLSKFTLANDTIIVGYYKFVDDGKKKVKKYVEISPRDMDLFLIKMGGKFSNARELAKKLEEERKRKNAEHYEKKSKADKLRQEKEEKNKPVDVVVNPKKKTDNVKTVKSDDEK